MNGNQHSIPMVKAGLPDNVAGALAYVTVLPAIVFLMVEPYNRRRFVRYNAFQCIALVLAMTVCSMVLLIPLLGLLAVPLEMVLFGLWMLCMWNAYRGKLYRLPMIAARVDELSRP